MNTLSLDTGASAEQLRAELGAILGLDEPVSDNVLAAALDSDAYAASLLSSRRHPQMLKALLRSPPLRQGRPNRFTTGELLARGGKSLAKWARTGFATTGPEVRSLRKQACLACPHRSGTPSHILQAGASSLGVCGLCGCPLSRKLAMASENCPGASDTNPRLSRWGDPMPLETPDT